MKISEVIKSLEDYQRIHGDIKLFAYEDDGYSSWVSGYKPHIKLEKGVHMISQSAYGG